MQNKKETKVILKEEKKVVLSEEVSRENIDRDHILIKYKDGSSGTIFV